MFHASSRHAETHERGRNFGRRPERSGWNPKGDFRPAEPLRNHGEIPVVAPSRLRDDSHRDLKLNYDMNGGNSLCVLEEAMQNGRCNVVGQITVNGKTLTTCQLLKIDSHYISFDNFHVLAGRSNFPQPSGKARVEFDGEHLARAFRQARSHFSVSRADFHPHAVVDANRARDPLLPTRVAEEMLPKLLR